MANILSKCEPNTRKFLWSMLIRPLYDYIFPFMEDMTLGLRNNILKSMKGGLKNWLGLRKSTPNEITNTLFGDVTQYINARALSAKAKIIQRFGLEKGAVDFRNVIIEKVRLLPSLSSIPSEFISLINKLNWSHCQKCLHEEQIVTRLTWYHLAKHRILIRNPELVLKYRINEWIEANSLQNPLKKQTIKAIMFRRQIWRNQLIEIHKSINILLNVSSGRHIEPGLSPLK